MASRLYTRVPPGEIIESQSQFYTLPLVPQSVDYLNPLCRRGMICSLARYFCFKIVTGETRPGRRVHDPAANAAGVCLPGASAPSWEGATRF
jgi:hypothetical protein